MPRFRLLLTIFLAFIFLSLGSFNAFGQGSKRKSVYDPIEEKDRDRPDLRSEWMMRGRTAPKGQSAAALRLRAHQQKMAMRAQRAAALKGSGAKILITTPWVALGPAPLLSDDQNSSVPVYGPVTGRSTAVAIDPSDATGNTVYIAGASGGVWKSTNAATSVAANVTWTPLTDQQASLTAGAVSVKSDGSVVLVGTGEPDNAIDSYYGVGILRSTDKGTTWTLVSSSDSGAHPFAGIGFTKFAWLPSSNTVVAAAGDAFKGDQENLISNGIALGMYLSTDGGQSWTFKTPTDNIAPFFSATDVTYNASAGKFFASIQYHGVYSSTNGTTWARLSNQPDPTNLSITNCPTNTNFNSITCPMFRGQITTVPGRNEMYFWYENANNGDADGGIWQSTNGGTSWKQIDETGITSCGDSNGGCGTQQAFYNLEISAVADGTGTDIYTGAVNLFRCKLASGATTCSTVDQNLPSSWLNLTHVYGCSTVANVHPDEHGLDFLVVGGKDIMYFGNDGGIYRALDGFTGLQVGSCSTAGTNQFDNLNASMGSMTQFVSFSIHPTDQNTLLGGTQDNGSPATSTATTSSQFITVLGGDGGYNAINPDSTTEWFASNPGSEIGICESGIGCNDNTFNYLASPDLIGNIDFGAFYTPFILDPQNSGEMLIGTCRVWRGDTATGTFISLSPNFDTDDSTFCGGRETNQVHGLAAGGPLDNNGLSNVIYAVTFGLGPAYGLGTGGAVWATTNASTTQLSNVTGSINPSNYALSSVAMDNSDATGDTAYVGVMGFGTPHVWKTTNAGGAWTDWSGSGGTALPDAPVNDVLVDTQTAEIYAATDVGLFVSSTTSPSWSEVGTPSAPGATGYLPNVPTSAIRIFDSGNVKKLRVSTYGRGIWEYSLPVTGPSFTLAVTATPPSTIVNQDVTWNIVLTPQNGYSGTVTLSCTAGAPATCSFSSNPIVLTSLTNLTVTLNSASAGPFNFSIQGTDGTITQSQSVSLTVTGTFTVPGTLTNPTSASPGQTTTTSMQLTPVGGTTFTSSVSYSCSGLPAGATCSFSPVSPLASGSSATDVMITVNTAGPFAGTAGGAIRSGTRRIAQNQNPRLWLPLTLPLAGVVLVGLGSGKISRRYKIVGLCLMLVLTGLMVACGGGSSTPPAPVAVSVSPGSVSTLWPNLSGAPAQTQQFSATVTGSSNTAVMWAISSGGTTDSISATGLYTAPTSVPSGAVTVTATSQADNTKSGSATVNIKTPTPPGTYPITVTVTEGSGTGSVTKMPTFNLTIQ